jgi:hypothetical protein
MVAMVCGFARDVGHAVVQSVGMGEAMCGMIAMTEGEHSRWRDEANSRECS